MLKKKFVIKINNVYKILMLKWVFLNNCSVSSGFLWCNLMWIKIISVIIVIVNKVKIIGCKNLICCLINIFVNSVIMSMVNNFVLVLFNGCCVVVMFFGKIIVFKIIVKIFIGMLI